jgi:hypothetical protein
MPNCHNQEDIKPNNIPSNMISFTRNSTKSLTSFVDALNKDKNIVYRYINKEFDKFIEADGFVVQRNSEEIG